MTADGFGREADYYRILAYTAALDLPEGLLIYCQHDAIAPARQVDVRNFGTRLRTYAVRLDRSPDHVEEELRQLAEHIVERVVSLEASRAPFGDRLLSRPVGDDSS